MTLVVDGASNAASSPTAKQGRDPDEWRLNSADPRDVNTSKYRLHTLDVYFWAQEDAKLIVDTLKSLLQPAQLDIAELDPRSEETPTTQHAATEVQRSELASPVVQNLENVAISDPAYQNGQTRNSQNTPQAVGIPPPPPSQQSQAQPAQSPQPQAFAPMAYNPAAPAAPEPIAHREDTPPPPEDGHPGLAAAAMHDNAAYRPNQQSGPYQSGIPPSQPWTGAPPGAQQPQRYTSPYAAPSQSTPLSFAGPPAATSPALTSVTSATSQRHGSTAAAHYVPDQQTQMYQGSAQQPVETPGAQFYSTLPGPRSSVSPQKPLQHVQPQYADYLSQGAPPPGGYSQFNYSAANQQTGNVTSHQGVASPYDVHSQVYRPTEDEAAANYKSRHGKRHSASGKPHPGTLEARTEKAEKKVSGFFKKLENKVGL
jgi:hypothetical protein